MPNAIIALWRSGYWHVFGVVGQKGGRVAGQQPQQLHRAGPHVSLRRLVLHAANTGQLAELQTEIEEAAGAQGDFGS